MPKTGNVTAVIPKHSRLLKRETETRQGWKTLERKRKCRNKVKTNSQTTPINDLENSQVFPIGCRKAGPYNQWSRHSQQPIRRE